MGTYWSNLVDNYLSTEPETTTEETTLVDKYKKGDVNTDGEINVSDLIVLQKYLLKKRRYSSGTDLLCRYGQ